MNGKQNLISAGASVAKRNLRYIVWFFVLNLAFAAAGANAFGSHAHDIMDHSLYADKLLHGFHLAVLFELISRPEFGPTEASTMPAGVMAILFVLMSLGFMPGVLLGYSSDHRVSRDEFYRACGRNLWRFIRLFIVALVVIGIVWGALMPAQDALSKAADKTNYERLPFFTQVGFLILTLLISTVVRIWFDLAQTDVVLRDQKAVRKSLVWAFRATRKNFGKLFVSYVGVALLGLVVLAAGLWLWYEIVPSASVFGGFLMSQVILFLLLGMRFWQRASGVTFYLRNLAEPTPEAVPSTSVAAAAPAGAVGV